MRINSISDLRKAFRHGPYAWPGGYPCYFVMADGEPLSFKAAKENRRELLEALTSSHDLNCWRPIGLEVNWEDPDLRCVHSGERIESAYAEPEESANGIR